MEEKPLTDKQLYEALLDCDHKSRGIENCRAILDSPHGSPKWLDPAGSITSIGWRGIHDAIEANDHGLARSLISEWRSDPDVQSVDVYSLRPWCHGHAFARPLGMTMRKKWRELAQLILDCGAWVTELVMVEMVVLGPPVDFGCPEVQGILEDILARGWDVNAPLRDSGDRFPPLLYAGKAPILFNWLLDHGASPHVLETRIGYTPVTLCARNKNLLGMQKLFALGAAAPHNNALHFAIRHSRPDHLAMLSLLVDHGADVNALLEVPYHRPMHTGCYMPKIEDTPLHVAASCHDYEAASFLIEKGANPYIRSIVDGEERLNALDNMRVNPNEDIVRLAEEKFGPVAQEESDIRTAIRERPFPGIGFPEQNTSTQ